MRAALVLVVVFLVSLLVWGSAVEPRMIDEKRWAVELPELPDAWRGRELAVIADLQVGMWLDNTGTIERIVDRLVEQRPALALIAGDFIFHPLGEMGGATERGGFEADARAVADSVIDQATALVRPLAAAGIPTYAVLGNHDYGMQSRRAVHLEWIARALVQSLEEAGIRVLRNEAVTVPAPAGRGWC